MSGRPGSQERCPTTPQRVPTPPDDLPVDAQQLATPPDPVSFDSPDVRRLPPLPPGASQPNVPFSSPVPHHLQSPAAAKRSQQKFSLLRKRGNKGTPSSSTTPPITTSPIEDDDDAWLVEGTSTNGHVNATVSVGREASTLSRSVDTLSLADSDSGEGATLAPSVAGLSAASAGRGDKDKRISKSRALAKKTSRLFTRNGHGNQQQQQHQYQHDHHHHHEDSPSGASLALPGASTVRQNSISSTTSSDSRRKHWSLSRVSSSTASSPPRTTPETSQPFSWHPPSSFALRRTTSQATTNTDVMPPAAPTVVSERQNVRPREGSGSSHLSPTVPARHHNSSSSASLISQHTTPYPSQHSQQQTFSHTSQQKQDTTLPGRMTSWFSNLLPANASDQSPSSLADAPPLPPSPLRKPTGVAASILSAARNKAVGGMRYLLDSDAQPDHCQDTMWVLGVPHPGYQPGVDDSPFIHDSPVAAAASPSRVQRFRESSSTSYSSSPPTRSGFGNFFGLAGPTEPATPPSDMSRNRKDKQKENLKWPEQFYDDFRSRVWCTYRSQYAPIVPLPPGQLLSTPESYFGAFVGQSEPQLPQPGQSSIGAGGAGPQPSKLSNGPWSWVKGEERGLTSDAGWGCMLRTGQSLLANALIHLHLGREWRLPSNKPSMTPESPLELAELESYATYVRILSWFLDDPSPLCPFSVHRMALIGKELGKEVGEWFGPSTAAGALKTLVNSFPLCGLSVVNAVDGIIYRSDVYSASNVESDVWHRNNDSPRRSRPSSMHRTGWGGKPVLILIGIRLGLDGVNPIYYESVKTLFTFPYSVGIAGGRPSSSYYFVASQANSLFYLDPHFTRPAVPLRVPPPTVAMPPRRQAASVYGRDSVSLYEGADDEDTTTLDSTVRRSSDPSLPAVEVVNHENDGSQSSKPLSPTELPLGPKPRRRLTLTQTLRIKSTGTPPRKSSAPASPTTPTLMGIPRRASQHSSSSGRPMATRNSTASSSSSLRSRVLPVDPQTAWYASAYSEPNLRSFHCDKIKKLPLSGLDPSMLLGFLCQTEAEFDDFCERVAKLPQKIFAVQDEPPMWSEDEDGLESVSEPLSDYDSDRIEDPDLDLDDVDEFGQASAPRPPAKRDDTITPLTAAAANLSLTPADYADDDRLSDSDVDARAHPPSEQPYHRARKSSVASTSSQRRIPRAAQEAGANESLPPAPLGRVNTDMTVDSDSDVVATPTVRGKSSHKAVASSRPRGGRAITRKSGRQPLVDPTPPRDGAEVLLPPSRDASLSAKASMHSLSRAPPIDIPPSGSRRRPVESLSSNRAEDLASAGDGELLGHRPDEDVGDDQASTPSSAPVLIERPPTH